MEDKKHKNEPFVPEEPKIPEIPPKENEPPFIEPNEPEVFPEELPVIITPENPDSATSEL